LFKHINVSCKLFWEDNWCGDRAIKEVFSDLFNIASNKGASIADNMECSNGSIQWNIHFSRLFHDWEVKVVVSFYKYLYDCNLRGEGVDKLWWLHSRKGLFEVNTFYRALSPSGSSSFPWKSIWKTKLPLEWLSSLGRPLGARFLLWIISGGRV
jgi:hypothetical protein